MKKLNVLILGVDARTHAYAWKISQSFYCNNLYIAVTDFETIEQAIIIHEIDLVIVSPEGPLVHEMGIVNYFTMAPRKNLFSKLKIFAPTKEAAQLEASKAYAKQFMKRNGIPTADFEIITEGQMNEAIAFFTLSANDGE